MTQIRALRAATRALRPPARRSPLRCASAQPPPRAQLAAASLPAARASKLALPVLDFYGLPWPPLCGPGLGLGLACALGPRRMVAKRSVEKKKNKLPGSCYCFAPCLGHRTSSGSCPPTKPRPLLPHMTGQSLLAWRHSPVSSPPGRF